MNFISWFTYALMAAWALFSLYYIYNIWNIKKRKKFVPYIYNSIPSVFTTLGILGTFIGIYAGLQNFDVNNISASIPQLLLGLKSAFLTSIIGIILSLIFGKLSQIVLNNVAQKEKESKKQDDISINFLEDSLNKHYHNQMRIIELLEALNSNSKK